VRIVRALVLLALAAALVGALDRSWSIAGARVPPFGRLLDPFAGLWRISAADREPAGPIRLAGLRGPVRIAWDARGVPHVFADDDRDLYLAQGWLVARHRLWQMDFQALAAAGRLAEVVGPTALPLDRLQRRLGLPRAAERLWERSAEDPAVREAIEAYAAGVNAWIDALGPADRPLEYKILDDRPRPWAPIRTALTLRSMAQLLSLDTDDVGQSRARARFGRETVETLFPTRPPFADPIVPAGTPFGFDALPIPPAAETFPDLPGDGAPVDDGGGVRDLGSNHWAIAGWRTAGGRPILAGDPHLPLTLPSIWYEIHLHGPDHDVYGVALPGVPGVVIGFNRDAAWSFTNAYSDAADWRTIEFRDASAREWRHGDAWEPVEWVEETLRVRGAEAVVERVPWTAHGPVVVPAGTVSPAPWIPPGAALRWTAHDRSDEIGAILALDRVRVPADVDEIVERFDVPGQNVAFAFRDGTIGVVHAGLYPLRWPEQGRYVGDGADPRFDWAGFVPKDQLPRVVDPERGFVGSANQPPTDGTYPYWLGWSYDRWERGHRIHALLAAMHDVVPADLVAMQNDCVGEFARVLLPALLARLPPSAASSEEDRAILADLRAWDGSYRADLTAPTTFDRWQRALGAAIWSDEFAAGPDGARLPFPRRDVTAALVLAGASPWFDDRTTPETETLDDRVAVSFRAAVDDLHTRLGGFGPAWSWGRVRPTRIAHLARLPGFGVDGLSVDGQYGTIRAVTGGAGPSWRMVVEVGDPPRAWGEYPGGQNGDPASARYVDGIEDWRIGRVRELVFPRSFDEDDARLVARTVLEPAP